VVLFIKPEEEELSCTKVILDCFGEASGLKVNMEKSLPIPIRCNDAQMQSYMSSPAPFTALLGPSPANIWDSPFPTGSLKDQISLTG
jgi:hypothetical protein